MVGSVTRLRGSGSGQRERGQSRPGQRGGRIPPRSARKEGRAGQTVTKIRTRTLIERLKRSLDVLQGDALAIVEAGRDNPAELAMAVNSRDPRKTRTAITAWSLIGPRWAAQTPSRLQARLPEGSPERRTLGRTTAETLRNAMYRRDADHDRRTRREVHRTDGGGHLHRRKLPATEPRAVLQGPRDRRVPEKPRTALGRAGRDRDDEEGLPRLGEGTNRTRGQPQDPETAAEGPPGSDRRARIRTGRSQDGAPDCCPRSTSTTSRRRRSATTTKAATGRRPPPRAGGTRATRCWT